MAATTRPYLCIFNGKAHMVDAKDPGAVVRHIVGAAVTELRPAHAREVAQWARDGKPLEIAGVTVRAAQLQQSGTIEVADDFDANDARVWLLEKIGVAAPDSFNDEQRRGFTAWQQAETAGQLDLMAFDEIRVIAPGFADAIANDIAPDMSVAGARATLEELPMPFARVVEAIATAKRLELYEPTTVAGDAEA